MSARWDLFTEDHVAFRDSVRQFIQKEIAPNVGEWERAHDFPESGPILIITDGYCDRVRIRREHAFLLPEGRSLPFVPKGKVFAVR